MGDDEQGGGSYGGMHYWKFSQHSTSRRRTPAPLPAQDPGYHVGPLCAEVGEHLPIVVRPSSARKVRSALGNIRRLDAAVSYIPQAVWEAVWAKAELGAAGKAVAIDHVTGYNIMPYLIRAVSRLQSQGSYKPCHTASKNRGCTPSPCKYSYIVQSGTDDSSLMLVSLQDLHLAVLPPLGKPVREVRADSGAGTANAED